MKTDETILLLIAEVTNARTAAEEIGATTPLSSAYHELMQSISRIETYAGCLQQDYGIRGGLARHFGFPKAVSRKRRRIQRALGRQAMAEREARD